MDAQTNNRYIPVCVSHFNMLWREQFPEVRIRKHCRFSKCGFCVEHRGVLMNRMASGKDRDRSKQLLRLHYQWSAVRERGLWQSKQRRSIESPDLSLCISLDGTDQFPQGIPHFLETTKVTANGVRMKLNVQIGIEAGQAPVIFCAWEQLRCDPNWTIETLDRMIRKAEDRRKGNCRPSCTFNWTTASEKTRTRTWSVGWDGSWSGASSR
jgi:hypothetical protein